MHFVLADSCKHGQRVVNKASFTSVNSSIFFLNSSVSPMTSILIHLGLPETKYMKNNGMVTLSIFLFAIPVIPTPTTHQGPTHPHPTRSKLIDYFSIGQFIIVFFLMTRATGLLDFYRSNPNFLQIYRRGSTSYLFINNS